MIAQQQKTSFVAQIWLELADDENPIWRGHIQHVQGKQKAYFQDLEEMSAFMRRVAGVPGPATPRGFGKKKWKIVRKPKE